jgi:malate/lactate dehydrogenase
VGARAVLITAAVDRGSAHTRADAVCRNFAQLPEIIGALDGDTYAIHTSVSDH